MKDAQLAVQGDGREKPEIVQLVESKLPDIQSAIPHNTIRALQLQTAFLSALNKKPELRECTQMSICQCLINVASLGIIPETPEQHAYLIPRNRNIAKEGQPPKWVKEMELQISYRGFVHMIVRGDRRRLVKSDVVHECDEFQFENGTNIVCRHVPNVTDPDRRKKPIIAAWALIEYPDGSKKLEVMDRMDLAKIKLAMLAQNRDKSSPAWKNWETEMYRKAPIKRMAKTSDLGPEIALAAEIDTSNNFNQLRVGDRGEIDNGAPDPILLKSAAPEPETPDADGNLFR